VEHLVLILGMMLVTWIPRMLPLTLLERVKLPPLVERFLGVLPAAALGALIVPGVIGSVAQAPWIGVVAVAVAALAVLFRGGMIVGVLAGVGTAFALMVIGA
jgi:branched-subunit amino acid transport protein